MTNYRPNTAKYSNSSRYDKKGSLNNHYNLFLLSNYLKKVENSLPPNYINKLYQLTILKEEDENIEEKLKKHYFDSCPRCGLKLSSIESKKDKSHPQYKH